MNKWMRRSLMTGAAVILAMTPMLATGCRSETNMEFTFDLLPALEQGHYETWAVFGEEWVSLGKFDIPISIPPLTFTTTRDLNKSDFVQISIEPEGDNDNVPSGIIVLSCCVAQSIQADLEFPVFLAQSKGSYILATPSDGENTNETSGIWFLRLPPPPTAGLELPELSPGWVYEGWVVNRGVPFSTGRFTSGDGPDGVNQYGGPEAVPPFPGEDFLQNPISSLSFPLDLADGTTETFITVEPDLNGVDPTGDRPFIKFLTAEIPAGAADHTNYDMSFTIAELPRGFLAVTIVQR